VIRNVAVPVLDGVSPFELGVLCEVFGLDRPDDPVLPSFDFALCAPQPGPVRTASGFTVDVDGRACTTHWTYADELARRFPAARVNAGVLYVDDAGVLTSAGTAAGIDACLYLVRQEFGERVATRLARRMVVPPHRDGGQQQYVETPIPPVQADTLAETLAWMAEHLGEELTVEGLAARAHMSARTFARRFRAETGTTPHHWLTGQRVLLAQRLLEESDQGIDAVADLAGFGSAAVLRHHFVRRVGTTPQAYRRTFCRFPA
jgi:AraC family transcriptional regulator, transcriptional activator FtrA